MYIKIKKKASVCLKIACFYDNIKSKEEKNFEYNYKSNEVIVNKQNINAKLFYEHLGFKTYKRR